MLHADQKTTDIDHAGTLRLLACGASWQCQETAALLEDAADEIERLRAALAEIERLHIPPRPMTVDVFEATWAMMHVGTLRGIARKALANAG